MLPIRDLFDSASRRESRIFVDPLERPTSSARSLPLVRALRFVEDDVVANAELWGFYHRPKGRLS